MTEPVMVPQADLEAMAKDLKKGIEVNEGLKRDLKAANTERDQAAASANRLKTEIERLRKVMPADKMQDENKGLRTAVSESHKKIGALEKELAAVKVESETRRKEVAQLNQRLGNVQNTFDMMQIARDKAYVERDKALVDLQGAADAYHKLQGEFNDFKKEVAERDAEAKKPKAKAEAAKA